MRIAYLDEAGISANERTTVVAAVIIDPDQHYEDLESSLGEMLIDYIPPEMWDEPFAFHAKELLWGGKVSSAFPRKTTKAEDRWQILEELLRIPRAFALPLIVGWYRKDGNASEWTHEASVLAHAMAFSACASGVNYHLRSNEPDQWAMLIAEDRPEARAAIKQVHGIFRESRAFAADSDLAEHNPWGLIGTHLREGVFFGAKTDAVALQIADAVACIVRRQIDGSTNNERFMKALFGAPIRMEAFHERQWGYERFFVEAPRPC